MKKIKSLKLNNINYGNLKGHLSDKDKYIWACNDRENILQNVENCSYINVDELKSFQNQLLSLITEANKRPKLSIWQELNEHLNHISSFSEIILLDKILESELNVAYKYLLENLEFSYLLPNMEMKLRQLLQIKNKTITKPSQHKLDEEEEKHYPLPMKKYDKKPSLKIMPENVVEWFVDPAKGDLFNPVTIDRNITVKPKKIKMKEFLSAIGNVAKEIIFSQYAFEKPLENLIKAFDVDLSEFKQSILTEIDDQCSEIEEQFLPLPDSEDFIEEKKNVDLTKGLPKPKSGRETVIYMIKCFHLREMRVAYLNYTKQRIRDLYSLTVVRKPQLEPEHYIFSSFGVIHRLSDGTGIAMSLTDWYRESILYYALKCIPFVKQFLVKKYFQGWRILTVRNRNVSVGKYLSKNLLTAHSTYGKSILQILKLLDEVSQITFVPTQLLEIQTETSFAQLISQVNSTANQYLIKFYKYVQIMVNETAAELYKALQFSQAQLHNNNLYSNDSIYMKKMKQKKREQALNDCLNQVYKLGDFVKLVNFMLNSKIVEISLNNICILSELITAIEVSDSKNNKSQQVAIFSTKVDIISFDSKLFLKAFPGVEDIESMFFDIINKIPKLILKHCYPFDGLIRSDYLTRFNDIILGNSNENRIGYSSILSSKSEIKTEIMNESENMLDRISIPDLPHIKLPKKLEDNLRVATPPAVNPNIFNSPSLKLVGHSIPAKFTPINTEDVFEILKMNPLYHNLIDAFTEIFTKCQEEMKSLFQEVKWLVDVRNEYNEWSKIDMNTEWINQSPYLYEQKLIKVKVYIQNLENTEKKVILSNKIFMVSFESIIDNLLSEMEFELESISDYILNLVRKLGMEFIWKITDVLQFLRERSLEVELFTKVVYYIGYSRDNHAEFQKSVDYIKSLFDMLRISSKHITEKDKSIEDEVTTLWESFMFQLQEANDFINNEKQNVLFGIKSRIKELEDAARNLEYVICGARYSTISEDLNDIIVEISNILEESDRLQVELNSLFKCYQSLEIDEFPRTVDLDQIRFIVNLVYSNWTLLFNSIKQMESWRCSLFSQFQVSSASETICDWQSQIKEFRSNYNSRIIIVEQIEDNVNEFASFMPIFRQLSSPMFTLQHWQQFFLQIGHGFIDPFDKLTVQDLIDFDVREHSRILDVLYNEAAMKNKANKEFDHHLRYWITKEFEFQQHVTDLHCQRFIQEQFYSISIAKTPIINRTRSELEKYQENKKLEGKLERLSRMPITNNEDKEIFIIEELNKLNEEIADSIISIQLRKTQRNFDDGYKLLVLALEDLKLTIVPLEECQEKWLFLERIFEEEFFVQAYLESAAKFVIINKDFLLLLSKIKQSPLVFHYVTLGKVLLSENDSENSNLKSHLLELIEMMNQILSNIKEILANVRHHFPRLYFLPDFQLIELLNCQVSQNIRNINRFIQSIFPAIKYVIFDETNNAVSVVSKTGEKMDFYKPVSPRNSVSQWLKEFELIFKSTLKFYIESCIVQQSEESNGLFAEGKGTTFLTERIKSTMFQEIDKIELITHRLSRENRDKVEELVNNILLTYESWLMKYPLQVLLVVDKIFFAKNLKKAISNFPKDVDSFKLDLMSKKNNYIHLINKITKSDDDNQMKIMSAIQNLIVLNDRHIEILIKLSEDPECSTRSFIYQTIVKYDITEDTENLLNFPNVPYFGNVTIECCNTRFIYDYEYITITRCDLFLTSVTEQVMVNMLLGLYHNEMPTIIGSSDNKLEIAKSFSEVLGRNLYSISSGKLICFEAIQKYILGALMSGSLLFVNNIDQISIDYMSEMSKYLWQLKLLLEKDSNLQTKMKITRRLSLPSKIEDEDTHKISLNKERFISMSERNIRSASRFKNCQTDYYEMQMNKLNKGKNWPFFKPDYDKLISGNCEIYIPNYVTRMELNDEMIDVRYGFGIFSGITNETYSIPSIPLSLKSQMRIHCLMEIDRRFNIKSYIIMAGQEKNSETLDSCISFLLDEVNRFQRHLFGVVCKLIPLVISKCDWSSGSPIRVMKQSFISEIGLRISNELKDRDIFMECLNKCFQIGTHEDDNNRNIENESDSGFLHQLKCQIRLKNREVLSSDIDKIMELKSCMDFHQIVVVTGPPCSGKTSSIDILVQALNSFINPGYTPRFDTKSRGNIDVLKSLSNERKTLSQPDFLLGKETNRKIVLKKVTLANFTNEELKSHRWINDVEKPSVLSSIFNPLLKLQKSEKFQLWLCVETDWKRINDHLSIIKSCLGEDVKLIMEVTDNSSRIAEISLTHGIVQFPRVRNINEMIIEQNIKSLLTKKLISYYGCKYLKEITFNIFKKLFDILSFQIAISQVFELEISWIIQSFDIMEILLLENKDTFLDQESINLLQKRLNTYLSFSIIQGARGVPYLVLVGKRLVSQDDYERMIREVLVSICFDVENKKDEFLSTIFGLLIDYHDFSLKPFHMIKGNQVPTSYSSCSDGVAKFLIQLLIKHGRSVFLNGRSCRMNSFTDLIRYNKHIKMDNYREFPFIRKSLHDRTEKYWDILSNKDLLFNAVDKKDIILLEDFSTDSDSSHQCNSLLQFFMEYRFVFDSVQDESCFTEKSLNDLVVVLTRDNELNEFDYETVKWTRWFTCINIIDPHLMEVPQILFNVFYSWFRQIPKIDKELSKTFAKKFSAFIVDVCITIENENRTHLISEICNSNFPIIFPLQQTWSRVIKITKSLTSLPLDIFVNTFRKFEKLFPLESESHSKNQSKDEILKAYKTGAIKVRIIRYLIYTLSRFMIDPLELDTERHKVMSVMNYYLDHHFFNDLSFEVDEILLKHFPLSIENVNEIIMLPSRICEELPDDSNTYYQPILEPHSWKILDLAKDSIRKIDIIKSHLEKLPHLKTFIQTDVFLKSLMKIYKHFCQYSLSKSALFLKSFSSLVSGYDWGVFISGLIQALHMPLNASSSHSLRDFYQLLKLAMHKAGNEHQKVVFHLDSNLTNLTWEMLSVLMKLIQQDSLVEILQFLYRSFDDNENVLIKVETDKEIRLTKVFLENIRRNLKILITVDTKDINSNKYIKTVSEWFLTSSHNYLVLDDQDIQTYKDTLDSMVPILSKSHSNQYRFLIEAHLYLSKYLHKYFQRFGITFDCKGIYLHTAISLYNFFFDIFRTKIDSKIQHVESAIKSIKIAEFKIDNLFSKLEILQKELGILIGEINQSSSQMKNMKERYSLALSQCKSQEKLIRELTEPLNDLKEKSKSNLSEVSPTYLAALETIRNLDPGAVEEIKTYVKPPQPVRDLVEIIFYLLGYNNNWEEIKEIMVKINLYEELLYFDKDHIDNQKYKYLAKRLTDETLSQESLINISQAAASLSGWLYAIFKYTNLSRKINPQLGQLLSFQDKVSIAQSELGKMKVRTDMMWQDLEAKIYEHKKLLSKKKSITDQIRDIKYKIDSSRNLLSDIRRYHEDWNDQRNQLHQSMQDLPYEIVSFIICNLYLSRFPLTMRNEILNQFQNTVTSNIKQFNQLTIFEDGELKNLIDWHQWNSLMKLHLDNSSHLSLILCCPLISFPEFGSMILIHYQNDSSGNLAEILKLVLESKPISEIRNKAHEILSDESNDFVYYIDCVRTDVKALEDKLKDLMKKDVVLLIDNIDLVTELGPTLHFLLYGNGNNDLNNVHPKFRLILLTRIVDSPIDLRGGLFTSSKLIHYEFTLTRQDVQQLISSVTIEICQPRLFEKLLQLDKQIFEINNLKKLQKKSILDAAAECISRNLSYFSSLNSDLRVNPEELSILDIPDFHPTILAADSKLLDFDSTANTVNKKYQILRKSSDKISNISDAVCLLLHDFGMFPYESIILKSSDIEMESGYRLFELNELLVEIKSQISVEVNSVTVHEKIDPEISEEFLEKLYISILISIIKVFDLKMSSSKLVECIMEFSIDSIVDDMRNDAGIPDNDVVFIKRAILCQNLDQLIVKNYQNSVDFVYQQTNDKISKTTLLLSLIIETNLNSLTGLSKTFVDNADLWQEYLKLPFMNSTRMPGFSISNQPELLYKAVIWRLLNPASKNEIYSSLIAHIFGQDIFAFSMNRFDKLEISFEKSTYLRPLALFTIEGNHDCLFNPLELIEKHHRKIAASAKKIVINCASKSDLRLLALMEKGSDSNQSRSIYSLMVEPCWIILLNAHLYSADKLSNKNKLLNFSNQILKQLLKNFIDRSKYPIHPECKLIIVCENSEQSMFPGLLMHKTNLFCCRRSTYLNWRIPQNEVQVTKHNQLAKAIINVYDGLFGNDVLRNSTVCNSQDLRIAVELSSRISPSHSQTIDIINLVFHNKILLKSTRNILNKVLDNVSKTIHEYLNHSISDLGLVRNVNDSINGFVSFFTPNDVRLSRRKSMNDKVMIDQQSIDNFICRLISICQQLNQIINHESLIHFTTTQLYIKKLAASIYHNLLCLPIWSKRIMSNVQFDSKITTSDINMIVDQYFISNKKLPNRWITVDQPIRISDWLDYIENLSSEMSNLIIDVDEQRMETFLLLLDNPMFVNTLSFDP